MDAYLVEDRVKRCASNRQRRIHDGSFCLSYIPWRDGKFYAVGRDHDYIYWGLFRHKDEAERGGVMIWALTLVLISELFVTVGHIFFKKGADHLVPDQGGVAWIKDLINVCRTRPAIIIGALGMIIGTIFWIFALKVGDLSVVSSMRSTQFVFVLVASYFFLGEKLDPMKVIGTLLIMVGICVIVMS